MQPVNSSITLYHKTYDRVLKQDKYTRYVIENVFITGGLGSSLNKGYNDANDISVRVWYDKNDLNGIEFSISDLIVKGVVNQIIEKKSDLKDEQVYTIRTVKVNNYGSKNMQHIYLGAK